MNTIRFFYRRFSWVTVFIGCMGCMGQPYSENWIDINYAGDTMEYHNLDIYLPQGTNAPFPAVVLVYGSAWFSNNLKSEAFKVFGKTLLDAGFAVVPVNHRSSSDALFPAQIHDIKAAIRFLRANGYKYQLDTSFIGITGYSSGGHLSSLAGTTGSVRQFIMRGDTTDIEGNIGEYPAYRSSVDAVADWFGPVDFLKMDSCGSDMFHNNPGSPESCLIGGPIQDNRTKCALANPVTYIDSTDPTFLIFHGDADPLVPHCQSEMLFNALKQNRVTCQFILVTEAGHGPGLFEDMYFQIMTDFFTRESTKP